MRIAWVLLLVAACGESIGERPLHYELGTCGVVDILDEDIGTHVAQGSVIEWSTNPPASGPHFQLWAAYGRSYTSLERGFWVHNLEHGAIVFAYRCDAGCPAEVALLEDAVRALPDDTECEDPVRVRSIVVADPLLPEDNMFVAIAWGSLYTATCVDPEALGVFARDFYGRAPEDLCANGASLGGTLIE